MRHRLAAASVLAFSLVGRVAQDKAPPANDPALPDQIAKLKTMVKDRSMEQDFLAMNLVTAMTEKFTEKSPKDQKAVVTALGEVFKLGPVRPADKSQLYRTVAEALSTCGEVAAPTLRKVLELDRIDGKEFTSLRAQLVLSLGKTKEEKQADWLLETAERSPDDEVAAAAGEALGNYDFLPLQKLRDISKRLISRYGEIDMKATQPQSNDPNAPIDFGPQNAAKTLEWIAAKWNATLTKLTGQTHQKAADWQRWLNKNKDWEPPKRS